MKVGFFGTPGIASHCLEYLCEKHDILFAVTSEDKPFGRNRALRCCEAKETAGRLGIDVIQPASLKDPEFLERIRAHDADIYVVVAFGKIIPREVFDYPPLKTINLHPSLLPKYRGAAPVEWALIDGERETGVTVQMINERLDAGDIVLQKRIAVESDMTAGDMYDIIKPAGAEMVHAAIEILGSGRAEPVAQDEGLATFCGKIDRDTAHIDWVRPSREIHNRVRGLNPKPVAWTTFRGRILKIYRTALLEENNIPDIIPGTIMIHQKKRLVVGTADGFLEVLSLQPETKKVMDALGFINGSRLEPGDVFE